MSEQKFVKIICDECKKEDTYEGGGENFPYSKGWCQIHNLNASIAKKITHRLQKSYGYMTFENLHFCSGDCFNVFLMRMVEAAKKSEDETLDGEEDETIW